MEFSNEIQQKVEEITKRSSFASGMNKIDSEQSKMITLEQIMDIPEHIHHLINRVVCIVKAPSGYNFHSSDNPVNLYNLILI